MRKLAPILLIVLFVFNLAGYYIAVPLTSALFKSVVRVGMQANVFEKDLVLIKIPTRLTKASVQDFQMTEGDEFQYKNKLYDVSSQKIVGDTTYFYCYNDKDEDQLYTGLDEHLKTDIGLTNSSSKNGNHDNTKKPLKVYLKTICNGPVSFISGFKTNSTPIKSIYSSLALEFDSPPPEATV